MAKKNKRKLSNKPSSLLKTLKNPKSKKKPKTHSDSYSESVQSLLQPYSKDQLISFAAELAVSHPSLLSLIRSTADNDISHRKIFVHGLGWDTTRQTLLSAFEEYGEIEDCNLVTDRVTGKAKGYAFILFKARKAARKALKEPRKKIGNRTASCQLASAGPTAPSPSPASQDFAGRKIYVSNVGQDVNPEKLRTFFAKFGEIESGPMGFDPQTGKSKGYALFVYKTVEGARKCLEEPLKVFDGHQLRCQKALEGKSGGKIGGGAAGITTAVVPVPQPVQTPGVLAAMAAAQNFALMGQNPNAALLNPFYGGLLGSPNVGLVNPLVGMGGLGQGIMGTSQMGQFGGVGMAMGGYGGVMANQGLGSLGGTSSVLGAYGGGGGSGSSAPMLQSLQHAYPSSAVGPKSSSKAPGYT